MEVPEAKFLCAFHQREVCVCVCLCVSVRAATEWQRLTQIFNIFLTLSAIIKGSVYFSATWGSKFIGGGGCERFSLLRTYSCRPWGPPSLMYNRQHVSFPGAKRQGHSLDHPHTCSTKIKERVELYIYSPCVTEWQVT